MPTDPVEDEDLRQGKGWFRHKWECPKRAEHTPGFDIGWYGAPMLNGKRIRLTGGKKQTHKQLKCDGCDLYVIVVPVEGAPDG